MALFCSKSSDLPLEPRPNGRQDDDQICVERPEAGAPPTMTRRVRPLPTPTPRPDRRDAEAVVASSEAPLNRSSILTREPPQRTQDENEQTQARASFQQNFHQFMRLRTSDPQAAREMIPRLRAQALQVTAHQSDSCESLYSSLRDVFRFYRAAHWLQPSGNFAHDRDVVRVALETVRASERETRDAEGMAVDQQRQMASLAFRISRVIGDRFGRATDRAAWDGFINGISDRSTRQSVFQASLRDSVARRSDEEMYHIVYQLGEASEGQSRIVRITNFTTTYQILAESNHPRAREMAGDGILPVLGAEPSDSDSDEVQHWDQRLAAEIEAVDRELQSEPRLALRLQGYRLLGSAVAVLEDGRASSRDASDQTNRVYRQVFNHWLETAVHENAEPQDAVTNLIEMSSLARAAGRVPFLYDEVRGYVLGLNDRLMTQSRRQPERALHFRVLAFRLLQGTSPHIDGMDTVTAEAAMELATEANQLARRAESSESVQERIALLSQAGEIFNQLCATESGREDFGRYRRRVIRSIENIAGDSHVDIPSRLQAAQQALLLNRGDSAALRAFRGRMQQETTRLTERAQGESNHGRRLMALAEARAFAEAFGLEAQQTRVQELTTQTLESCMGRLERNYDPQLASRVIDTYLAIGNEQAAETQTRRLREHARTARRLSPRARGQIYRQVGVYLRQLMISSGGVGEREPNIRYLHLHRDYHQVL